MTIQNDLNTEDIGIVKGEEIQSTSVTDIISEGPIHGLVDGPASVFLNDNPQAQEGAVGRMLNTSSSRIELTNGSANFTITINKAIDFKPFDSTTLDSEAEAGVSSFQGKRHLAVRDTHSIDVVRLRIFGGLGGVYLRTSPDSTNWWPSDLFDGGLRGRTTMIRWNFDNISTDFYLRPRNILTTGTHANKRIRVSLATADGLYTKLDKALWDKWKDSTYDTGTIFIDRSAVIKSLNAPTISSGVYTYTGTLEDTWNGNKNDSFDASSDVDGTANTITITGHVYSTGDPVVYTSGAATDISGLTDGTEYFIIKHDANKVKLAANKDDAIDGTAVGISVGSGTTHNLEVKKHSYDDKGYFFRDTNKLGAPVDLLPINGEEEVYKTRNAQSQFRPGTLTQLPLFGAGGDGSTAVTNQINLGISQTNESGFGGEQDPILLIGSSTAGFNLSNDQIETVDEVKVRWKYAGGFRAINGDGKERPTYIAYTLTLATKEESGDSFENVLRRRIIHSGYHLNAVSFEETFDLNSYRPFVDFRIKVEREYSDEDPGISTPNGETWHNNWTNITKGTVDSVTSIFKEKLIYPLTAVGKVTFSNRNFQNLPTRTYHCKGMLVKVPSNYVTRDESSDGKTANYYRDPTTGIIGTKYRDWDGNFRAEKVYTNNPAWIFYDIITNNRYGLGDFVAETDIDKYALYKIARYCDEMVDDGNGGTEPRYTLNTYLTKATDAFKVLKDIASNFVTMLYYLDGKLFPVQDVPAGPMYNFSKANVLEGEFTYESTGTKTRINQVVVSWNNPDNNYKIEPLIVEDRRNIAESGAIITENAFAFGCTSEGQAYRYGKWKLWTAANQQELVTFKTGINGSYITPGDIINVQDSDKHGVRYSGRIASTGTLDANTIPLDSAVTLNSGSTYTLGIIIQKFGAFAAEDFTLNDGSVDISYKKGDHVPKAYLDPNEDGLYTYETIDSETDAINAKLSNNESDSLNLVWNKNFIVEERTVSSSAGSRSSLEVSSDFSATPAREDIWVLTEKDGDGNVVASSAKEYRVLSVAETTTNEYEIVGAEYYNDKYAAVEEDFTLFVADPIAPRVKATDVVPGPEEVWAYVRKGDSVGTQDLHIAWSLPEERTYTVVGEDGVERDVEIGRGAHSAEIHHDIPFPDNRGLQSPIRYFDRGSTMVIRNCPEGKFRIGVSLINSIGNTSFMKVVNIDVRLRDKQKAGGLFPDGAYGGGTSNRGVEIV